MADQPKYTRGDWLRWQRSGGLVIGTVVYVLPRDGYPWGFEYVTDQGTVAEADVLEARSTSETGRP